MSCELCNAIQNKNTILFEDEDIYVFLAEKAATMAHIIITTKEHFETIEQVPDYLVAWCFAISSKFSKLILESLNVQGLNLLVEVGAGAGQVQPHFVLNLIPRVQNDNLPLTWQPTKVEQNELMEHQALYKKATANRWVFEQKEGVKTTTNSPATPSNGEVIKQVDGEDNYLIKQLKRMP